MAVFWFVAPYSLVEVYRRFGDTRCLHHQGAAVKTSNPTNFTLSLHDFRRKVSELQSER
jgi:hypothetical protein